MDQEPAIFLSLPTEVRLMIYRYVTNESDANFKLDIGDLDPRAYRAGKRNGLYVHRTAYQPKHPQNAPYSRPRQSKPRYKSQLPTIETTYKICRHSSRYYQPAPNILLVNHQFRAEALAPFYAKSNLRFRSMSAVIPFLTDQRDYLACFKSFKLSLNIDPDGHSSEAHQLWVRTFATMASMPSLQLSFLKLTIKDLNRYCFDDSLRKRDHMRWIDALAKIQGLITVESKFLLDKVDEETTIRCGCYRGEEDYDWWVLKKEMRRYSEMKLDCYLERRMVGRAEAGAESSWLAGCEQEVEEKKDYVWHLAEGGVP